MKKIFSLLLISLIVHTVWAQSGEGYDPQNPGDPDVYYTLEVEASPKSGGSISPSSRQKLSPGKEVYCYANAKTGYKFKNWMIGDSLVSSNSSMYFTMPEHDVVLTAHFDWIGNDDYNPQNPGDPFADGYQHKVTLYATPSVGGYFNSSSFYLREGESTNVYAYSRDDYRFVSWKQNGTIVSTSNPMQITMGTNNQEYTAQFVYDPENPGNPSPNSFNSATGELVIDEFITGDLNRAISSAIGGSENYHLVQSIKIIGRMSSSDFGFSYRLSNCSLIDLARTTGYTEIPRWSFENLSALTKIVLPSNIERISSNAFYGCGSLFEIVCYATVPPILESGAFNNTPTDFIVRVPSSTLSLYTMAEGWKDFAILPLDEETCSINVSLPDDASDGRYKNMTLELDNISSGQILKYLITDRTNYAFANLVRDTKYNLFVKSASGSILGSIQDIEVGEEDVKVAFERLLQPKNIVLNVLADNKTVTEQVTVSWTDLDGKYIGQGNVLSGIIEGTKIVYRLSLPQTLGSEYIVPSNTEYTVTNTTNNVICKLQPFETLQVAGCVNDLISGSVIPNATITLSQRLNGKYSNSQTVKADNEGKFVATIYNAPLSATIAANNYLSQTIEFEDVNNAEELNEVFLKRISGAVITTNFAYLESAVERDNPEIQYYYGDYANVAYTIFNNTTGKEIKDFNVQYPSIVLLEEVAEGDNLMIKASSKTNGFLPVQAITTIDAEQHADANFNVVELGKIKAKISINNNASAVGSLYDAKGKLLQTYSYSNDSLTIGKLVDGTYTLVSMGKSKLFNSIYDLSQLPLTGLVLGSDYAQTSVEVVSGRISTIDIGEVPTLDESKLYYTGDNTSFTVNKSSIVAGNYLTMTGHIDFKPAYSAIISNVNLIVDLPESCQLVEKSVLVGNTISSYTLQDNRITIPLANYTDCVRFCVIPTVGGDFAPNAFAEFVMDGETVIQPIGSANYQVKDLSINVPTTTANSTIHISGTAIRESKVEIYDGDILIGQTESLANGTWRIVCELNEPYNLTKHEVYAKVTNGSILLTTNHVECQILKDDIVVKTIKMTHYNKYKKANETVCIDYQNQTADKNYYDFYDTAQFTFNVDFNRNDTTCIDNVNVLVWNSKNESTRLPASYSRNTNNWVATEIFSSDNLPTSFDVEYDVYDIPVIPDRECVDAKRKTIDEAFVEVKTELESIKESLNDTTAFIGINESHDKIDALLVCDEFDINELKSLLSQVVDTTLDYEVDEAELDSLYDEFLERKEQDNDNEFFESLINDCSSVDILNYSSNMLEDLIELEKINSENYKVEKISFIDNAQLLEEGYECISCSDSTNIYYKYSEEGITIIDPVKSIKLSFVGDYNVNNSRASRTSKGISVIDPTKWANCLTTIKVALDGLRYLKNGPASDLKHNIAEVGQFLKDIADGTSCFYYTALGQVELHLKQSYENKLNKEKSEIEYNKKLKDYHGSSINELTKKIEDLDFENSMLNPIDDAEKIKANKKRIETFKSYIKTYNDRIAEIEKNIAKHEKRIKEIEKWHKGWLNKLRVLPKTLSQGARLSKTVEVIGKGAGPFGIFVEAYCLYVDIMDARVELREWEELLESFDKIRPCNNDRKKFDKIYKDCEKDIETVKKWIISTQIAQGGAILVDIASFYSGPNLMVQFGEWVISGLLNGYSEIVKNVKVYNKYLLKRGEYYSKSMKLKCFCECDRNGNGCKCLPGTCICKRCCNKCKCKEGGRCTCKGSCKCKPKEPKIDPKLDPSGYVYEGVASNRLEGVTATAYYKEQVEDMYGDLHDNIVKWDAEEYAQENPLFTDENGMYAWDVPQGMWQVKFEKEGYETTYSEWLPVPPPQLDVNVAMTQVRQPEVKSVHAYKDGVEIEFDKYMLPETLTPDNIYVTANGVNVEGEVAMLNEEVSYEGEGTKYASKVRFNPTNTFVASELTLTIANKVKSYAGIQMQDTYTQSFDIEPEIAEINVASEIKIPYEDKVSLTINVTPCEAAVGKILVVKSASDMIASVEESNIIIDEEGKAVVTICGELPGTTALTFTIDGYDVSATSMVRVVIASNGITEAPTANIPSGTTVAKGTAITLKCATEGASMYYTLDGSCPCDEATRLTYTEPIVINKTVTIKAMAVAPDMTESDIVEFTYIIDSGNGLNEVTLDADLKIYPIPVHDKLNVTADGKIIKSVALTNMSGSIVVKTSKPATMVTLEVSSLTPGIYIINVATDDTTYSRKIMKVE